MTTQRQATIDNFLRRIARDVKDARDINARSGDMNYILRHMESLLASIRLETLESVS